jgi:capsular polysaccharide export protein
LRQARLRSLLPVSDEARAVGREAFPKEGGTVAGAAIEIVARRVRKADAVVVWNGSRDIARAAVRVARAQGKPVVYVENGFLPGTYQIDREGINFESSLARLTPEALRSIDVPAAAFEAATGITFRQRPLGRDTGLDATDVEQPSDLPADFVLFASQVHDDSQILRFSPDYPSVGAAIRYVAAECEAAGLPLVVKEHPSDHGRVDYGPLKASLPAVRFVERADNAALIALCRSFVTVNSSLALQAVDAGKPVYTLGNAAYNIPGIATRVRPPDRLRDALTVPDVDADLRRRYLAFLAGVALVQCKSRIPDDAELRAVMARIASLV